MLTRLYLHTKQFDRTVLDFTHPETGEPLKKICLIGSNGTGKSSILKILKEENVYLMDDYYSNTIKKEKYFISYISIIGKEFNSDIIFFNVNFPMFENNVYDDIYKIYTLTFVIQKSEDFNFNSLVSKILQYKKEFHFVGEDVISNIRKIINESYTLINPSHKLGNYAFDIFQKYTSSYIIHIPDEYKSNLFLNNPLPNSTLGEANDYKHLENQVQTISNDTIEEFWKSLMYHTNYRRRLQDRFENLEENLTKSKAQLIKEFNYNNPDIIDKMAIYWNKILDKCGLELDVANINFPYQISDKFEMFIRLKNEVSTLPYNEISTGIRNYIIKVGHLFSLYFNNNIQNAYVLFDEPENGLYPDFLLDMIEIYEKIVEGTNTQMFFSTHSPIIASQFEKHEKIILSWNENYKVDARKGSSPIGDDPNDVLDNDFNMPNITNKKGQEAWKKFLVLKRKIRESNSSNIDKDLLEEYSKLSSEYNF